MVKKHDVTDVINFCHSDDKKLFNERDIVEKAGMHIIISLQTLNTQVNVKLENSWI